MSTMKSKETLFSFANSQRRGLECDILEWLAASPYSVADLAVLCRKWIPSGKAFMAQQSFSNSCSRASSMPAWTLSRKLMFGRRRVVSSTMGLLKGRGLVVPLRDGSARWALARKEADNED
jgi:hypothetical protein